MKKLTRAQIREGLKAVPIETVLLGATGAKERALTQKQKEFARQIALGETKAGAYRKSRETKAKPSTASRQGQELMKVPAIIAQVEAYKVALEAQKFATPAHLRALTIHKLTEGALDPDMPPAQRVKCLELLGKITEVALFTERREIIKTTNSEQIRKQLLDSIRSAIKIEAIDVEASGDELLAEISKGVSHIEQAESGDGAPGTPQNFDLDAASGMHSNPHIGLAHLPNVSGPSNGDGSEKIIDVQAKENFSPVHPVTSDESL